MRLALRRPSKGTALLLALVGLLAGAASSEVLEQNHHRLRTMPLSQRMVLSQRLQVFDTKLTAAQRESLRDLDRRIREADPEVRDRYLALIRRYYDWTLTLPAGQRQKLAAASAEERFELVRKLLAAPPKAEHARTDWVAALTPALNPLSLLDQAHFITVWLALTPRQRAEVNGAPAGQRSARLERLGQQIGVKDERTDRLKRFEDEVTRRQNARAPAAKKQDNPKAQAKGDLARRLIEVRFLSKAHLQPVSPEAIARFTAALPDWILESLDDLPPVAARERLAILYRLIYADGEMPATGPARPPESAPQSAPKGRPAPTGPGAPF
jgi:hypothetical protein